MDWLRWYHGACSDAKWTLVARKAHTNMGTVVAIWVSILEHASQQADRGSVVSYDPETIDALYGYEDGTCQAVLTAMIEKEIIKDGCIAAWSKRQPISDAERSKRYRDRRKHVSSAGEDREEVAPLSDIPQHETTRNITPRHANDENVTLRTEKIRTEKNIKSKSKTKDCGDDEQMTLIDDFSAEETEIVQSFCDVEGLKVDGQRLIGQFRSLKREFPGVDGLNEARKMALWIQGKKSRAEREKANLLLFVRNWVERASKPTPPHISPQRARNGPEHNPDGSIGTPTAAEIEHVQLMAEKYKDID